MSNNPNQNLNTDTSENREPTPDEIRTVLKPLFEEFNQVLQKYGLKDVEVVDFTTIVSSKVLREATDSSQTILDEYNDILRKTGFSDVYKDLEIINFTIAATSLVRPQKREDVRSKKREDVFTEMAKINERDVFVHIGDERTELITIREPITDERREQLLLFLKGNLAVAGLGCACKDKNNKCKPCPDVISEELIE